MATHAHTTSPPTSAPPIMSRRRLMSAFTGAAAAASALVIAMPDSEANAPVWIAPAGFAACRNDEEVEFLRAFRAVSPSLRRSVFVLIAGVARDGGR